MPTRMSASGLPLDRLKVTLYVTPTNKETYEKTPAYHSLLKVFFLLARQG